MMRCSVIRRLLPLVALLSLAPALRVGAQEPDTVEVRGRVEGNPLIVAWSNGSERTQLDSASVQGFRDQLTGSDWSITTQRGLVIDKEDKNWIRGGRYAYNNTKTFYVVHALPGAATMDAVIDRDAATNRGSGVLFLTLPNRDGTSTTLFVRVNLNFAQGGGPPPTPEPETPGVPLPG
jgi:hypothetical protein